MVQQNPHRSQNCTLFTPCVLSVNKAFVCVITKLAGGMCSRICASSIVSAGILRDLKCAKVRVNSPTFILTRKKTSTTSRHQCPTLKRSGSDLKELPSSYH